MMTEALCVVFTRASEYIQAMSRRRGRARRSQEESIESSDSPTAIFYHFLKEIRIEEH
jgi:hypothetical protein